VHPGFSDFAGSPVEAAASTSLESQTRYITCPALAMDALQKLQDGRASARFLSNQLAEHGCNWLCALPEIQ
jgi:hypothetical protein